MCVIYNSTINIFLIKKIQVIIF